MKIRKFFTVFMLPLFFLISCNSAFLPAPDISDPATGGNAWGAPIGLSVSHGLKGHVSLTWEAVKNADRYYVYSVDTPASSPIMAGASSTTSCSIEEKAGSSKYYRVTAVKDSGKETQPSVWVLGTTLAKPQITSITPKEGSETSAVTINWWMSNLIDNTRSYGDQVRYKISVKDASGQELSPVFSTALSAEITGLKAKTDYVFRISAYLASDPDKTEDSEWIDEQTARRMKPEAPGNLTAAQGLAKTVVDISWTIPEDLVEYPSGDGTYTPLQIYFKVFRRAMEDQTWVQLDTVRIDPTAYLPGGEVKWTDGAANRADLNPKPEIQYVYKVQSYADSGKSEISSDNSSAETTGWLLRQAQFLVKPERNNDSNILSVKFDAAWNNYGVNEDKYSLTVKTFKAPIGNFPSESDWIQYSENGPVQVSDIHSISETYNLTDQEGYYRYLFELSLDGSLMQSYTSTSVTVTGRYVPLTPELTIAEGWTDKTALSWTFDNQATAYELSRSETEDGVKSPIDITGSVLSPDGLICTFEDGGLESGKTYYYELTARSDNENESVYSNTVRKTAGTLGVPAPAFESSTIDYETVTLTWNDVPRVKTEGIPYKITYSYEGDGGRVRTVSFENEKTSFSKSAEGICTLTFAPEESDNVLYSGKAIDVRVSAESPVSVSPEGTTTAKTLGPAMTAVNATVAQYTDKVNVRWNKVEGASGYLVTRSLAGTNLKDTYYVNAALQVQLQVNPDPVLLDNSFASVTLTDGVYILADMFKRDISSDNDSLKGYYQRQSMMPWGNTYLYTVTPLKDTDTALPFVMRGEMPAARGLVLGYGLNVQATKARDATKVIVTWDNPPNTPSGVKYTLYRKEEGGTLYEPVNTAIQTQGKTEFVDTPDNTSDAFIYLVGIDYNSAHSDPREDSAFRSSFGETETSANFGYTLNAPVIMTVTKGTDAELNAQFAEKVIWNAPVAGKSLRGAQGYEIEIRNPNLPLNNERDGWYLLETVETSPSGDRTYNKDTQVSGMQALKMLRDYRHYYRIRAYNGDGEDRVYSNYSNMEWGARQITNLEFARTSLVAMSIGMYKVRGTSGSGSDGNNSTANVSSTSSFNWGPSDYTISIKYNSWLSSLKPLGESGEVTSVVVNGELKARGGLAGGYQTRYWTPSAITVKYITGDGTVSFEGDGSNKNSGSTTRTSGAVTVKWNGEEVRYDMASSGRPFNIPFAFGGSDYLNDTEEWK